MTVVEKHLRYSAPVDDLPAAWAFVLEFADEFKAPSIDIHPVYTENGMRYDAVIHGHVNTP